MGLNSVEASNGQRPVYPVCLQGLQPYSPGTGAIDEVVTLAEGLAQPGRQRAAIDGILSRADGPDFESFGDDLSPKIGDPSVNVIATEQVGKKLAANDLEVGKAWVLSLQTSSEKAAFEAAIRGVAVSWLRRESGQHKHRRLHP